jgi:hypothetical protein
MLKYFFFCPLIYLFEFITASTLNKKASRLGGLLLSVRYRSCSSRLGQCPPRLARRRGKDEGKEKEEAETSSLSLHFELHES